MTIRTAEWMAETARAQIKIPRSRKTGEISLKLSQIYTVLLFN